jgi:transposase InsO family protein
MADHLRTELCTDAVAMAIESRRPGKGLVHHSDRGVQYASVDYQRLLQSHDVQLSMSRVGDCYDNAAMESFWGTLKTELVHPTGSTRPGRRPGGRSSSTSSAGTIAGGVTPRSATRAPNSSRQASIDDASAAPTIRGECQIGERTKKGWF